MCQSKTVLSAHHTYNGFVEIEIQPMAVFVSTGNTNFEFIPYVVTRDLHCISIKMTSTNPGNNSSANWYRLAIALLRSKSITYSYVKYFIILLYRATVNVHKSLSTIHITLTSLWSRAGIWKHSQFTIYIYSNTHPTHTHLLWMSRTYICIYIEFIY